MSQASYVQMRAKLSRGICHFDSVGSGPGGGGKGKWERGKKDLYCNGKVDGWSKLCPVSL